MKNYITAIATANPAHKVAQRDIARFMARAQQMNEQEAHRLQAIFRASGIRHRYSVIEDYGRTSAFRFFPDAPDLEPFPTVKQRMMIYQKEALMLSLKAIEKCMDQAKWLKREQITHLITVSCTGMYAPGLDIALVEALELNYSTQRTAINFMGCYAAFNGLKAADAICKANPEAKVLVVCTELCTLHFQRSKEEDNLLANALFSDGSAAVLIENTPSAPVNLELQGFHCDLAVNGKQDMAWQIGNHGFEMRLSAYVPDVIQQGIRTLAQNLLKHLHLELDQIDYYAIHPGGKKILSAIEQELEITAEDNRFAYEVLRNYGNMSSPTILFVLQALKQSLDSSDHDKQVLSFAFGPGLTLESMLLKVVVSNE
jgi:alpha-pyrone synthase